jgi:predicted transcriptional regulator
MSQGIASLHKILKDETRRKILLLLEERGSVSYTDLMASIGIGNTGKLNYHLKILNGLIVKNGDGRYSLTDKGKLSIRLLEEFCKKTNLNLRFLFPRAILLRWGSFL